MQFYNTYEEVCRETQQTVRVEAFVEATGGFGCAVDRDAITYECSRQEECPVYKRGGCQLNK